MGAITIPRCISGRELIERFKPSPSHVTAWAYSQMYGLSPSSVYTMIRQGRLKYQRVRRWFFVDSSVPPPELLPAQVEAIAKSRAIIAARLARQRAV